MLPVESSGMVFSELTVSDAIGAAGDKVSGIIIAFILHRVEALSMGVKQRRRR